MKPIVDTAELKRVLESTLGGKIARMDLVQDCSRPENFAVRMADGVRYAVKCCKLTPSTTYYVDATIAHLQELEAAGAKSIRLVKPPFYFGENFRVVITSWCFGERIMPNKLTERQQDEFLKCYREFAECMQHTTHVLPPNDPRKVREEVISKITEPTFNRLFASVMPWFGDEYFAYRNDELKVTHADMHHGNFFWSGDEITGFLDLEDFRYGYATDDLIRYIVCAAEHSLWYDFQAKRRLLKIFKRMIPLYPAHQWHIAINWLLIRKAHRRLRKTSSKTWYYLNMKFRIGLYRKLHAMVGK